MSNRFVNNINLCFTEDYSSPSSLYKYNASCKLTPSSNSSFNKTINTSFNGSLTSEDLIQDEEGLESYLKEVAQQEKKFNHSKSVDQPSNLLSSFWSHSATRSPNEVSPLLRKCAYQLAPTTGWYSLIKCNNLPLNHLTCVIIIFFFQTSQNHLVLTPTKEAHQGGTLESQTFGGNTELIR